MTTKEAERVKLEEWGNPFGFEYTGTGGLMWSSDWVSIVRARHYIPITVRTRNFIEIRFNPLGLKK